jgi:hypothetical protein
MAEPIRVPYRDPSDVAGYISAMSADLAAMARRHGLDTLGYLLEMVRLEAQSAAGPPPVHLIEDE